MSGLLTSLFRLLQRGRQSLKLCESVMQAIIIKPSNLKRNEIRTKTKRITDI